MKKNNFENKKIAIVCDWLTTYGGAEKVVKTISDIFPNAPIFTSQYSKKNINWFNDRKVVSGWLDFFPARLRKILGVFRLIYFRNLRLDDFDIIISVCCAESKGIRVSNKQLYVCYLQGPPTQYYWGMYEKYIENPGFGIFNFIVRIFFRILVYPMRFFDFQDSKKPDFLLANSSYSQIEIKKYYNRGSDILFPPVEVDKFKLSSKTSNYYITTSRQVNWKRLDIAVEAFCDLGNKLVLVGDGAEHSKLKNIAKGRDNIEFVPRIDDINELSKIVSRAKGFIFPSVEPFGIAPVEAISAGVPVVALNQGGSLDYILDGENGVFFDEQNSESLKKAILRMETLKFDKNKISNTADKFSVENFKSNFKEILNEKYNQKFKKD